MVALEKILDHDLPIGLDGIFPPLAKRERDNVNASRTERLRVTGRAGPLVSMIGVGVDEDESGRKFKVREIRAGSRPC